MATFASTLRSAAESLTEFLTSLDAKQRAQIDAAIAGGATLGIEVQLMPTPAVFVVLREREGPTRFLAEIVQQPLSGAPGASLLQ